MDSMKYHVWWKRSKSYYKILQEKELNNHTTTICYVGMNCSALNIEGEGGEGYSNEELIDSEIESFDYSNSFSSEADGSLNILNNEIKFRNVDFQYEEQVKRNDRLVDNENFVLWATGFGSFYNGPPLHPIVNDQMNTYGMINVEYSWWVDYIDNRKMKPINAGIGLLQNMNNDNLTQQQGGGEISNHHYQYGDLKTILKMKKDIPIGLESIGCQDEMFISFIAKKPIKIGEELFIDVVKDSVSKFKYINNQQFGKYCL